MYFLLVSPFFTICVERSITKGWLVVWETFQTGDVGEANKITKRALNNSSRFMLSVRIEYTHYEHLYKFTNNWFHSKCRWNIIVLSYQQVFKFIELQRLHMVHGMRGETIFTLELEPAPISSRAVLKTPVPFPPHLVCYAVSSSSYMICARLTIPRKKCFTRGKNSYMMKKKRQTQHSQLFGEAVPPLKSAYKWNINRLQPRRETAFKMDS